jgi:hypothetical protein
MSQKSLGGNMASVLLPFAVIPTSAATRENLLELLLEERSFVAALLRMTTKGRGACRQSYRGELNRSTKKWLGGLDSVSTAQKL